MVRRGGSGVTGKVWLTTAEAAEALGYKSRGTVVDLIHAGELKAHRRGRVWRVPVGELERLSKAPTEGDAA